MACYHPIRGFQDVSGGPVSFGREPKNSRELMIGCGQCIGCRLDRSRYWAIRCDHERSMWKRNCFITLTYAPGLEPEGQSLYYPHFQDFMKRLRRRARRRPKDGVRFFMCGEYGENFGRPHYHACLFNFDFDDKSLFRKLPDYNLYRSECLDQLWPHGFASIGDLNFQTAAYTARYVCDKVTGPNADDWYTILDPSTGEIFKREPEFCHMSLKPGIGATWFDKYFTDVFPHGKVVVGRRQVNPPKYYDRRFQELTANSLENDFYLSYDEAINSRQKFAAVHQADSSPERLRVREVVAKAKLSQKRRNQI